MARAKKYPQKKTQDEIDHGRLIEWVNSAEDAGDDARQTAEKCRDYYDSKQLSAKEIAKLEKRGQAPVVINRIKPKTDAMMGMEKAAKTTAKAFPRTPKHEKGAEAATESIRFVLQDNSFDQVRSPTWENILIEGTGGCDVIVKPGGEGGASDMKIIINHIEWDRLIWDPHCRTKAFTPKTCRFLGQVVWMDYDEAVDMYPEAADVLENMQSGSQTYEDKPRWMDGVRRRVKIVELYYRKKGDVWYACFTRGGYCEQPKISPYKNEEGETEWPYEFASAFVDREGGRYGPIKQLLDVQDEINKRRSKALHLMSVRQTFGTKGTVEDVNKARQELAKPDGHLEIAFGEFGKDFGILPTGDMAAAQFNLLTESKMEIDSVGANAAMQGKDKTVQSGVALGRREQAGQTEIGPVFDVLRYWQYRVFRKVWNRVKQYWKAEKWIRVTDDEHNLRWLGLNKPVTKGEQMMQQAAEMMQQKGMPPEQIQQQMAQLQQQIALDPMMKEVVDTDNDIAKLDVDIILSEVPDVLTAQIEDFKVLGEMVKSGFQMPPLAVIEASPLSNKDKIIKMMKEGQQLPPEVQDKMKKMQEEAQKLAEENQQLKSGLQEAQMKIAARAEEKNMDAKLEQMRITMEQRLEQQKSDSATSQKALQTGVDGQFKRWEARLKAETAIEVAEIGAGAEIKKSQITAAETAVQ